MELYCNGNIIFCNFRTDVAVQSDVFIPQVNGTEGAFVAVRVDRGGCDVGNAKGLFFSVYLATQKFTLTLDYSKLY